MPAPIPYLPLRGFIGYGVETVAGTSVPTSVWSPFISEGFEKDPGVILDKLVRASKDIAYNPALGEQKVDGKLEMLFYLDKTLGLFGGAVGTDTYQTAGAASGSVALSTNAAAGASSVSLAAQTVTPIAAGDWIELRTGAGAASLTNLSEVHKVLSVTGAGPYTVTLQTGETLVNAYTSASATVYRVVAATVITHYIYPDQPNAGTWKTLTIEKYAAGVGGTSQIFPGTIISKAGIKMTTKETARASYDFFSGSVDTTATASTPSFFNTTPMSLTNYGVNLFSSADNSITSADLELDNSVKGIWTFNNQNLPATALPTERKITGKWTNLAQNLAYYNNMGAGTTGNLTITFTQGTSVLTLLLGTIVITKLSLPIKVGDGMMYDASWQAVYNNTNGNSMYATFASGSIYLPLL